MYPVLAFLLFYTFKFNMKYNSCFIQLNDSNKTFEFKSILFHTKIHYMSFFNLRPPLTVSCTQ